MKDAYFKWSPPLLGGFVSRPILLIQQMRQRHVIAPQPVDQLAAALHLLNDTEPSHFRPFIHSSSLKCGCLQMTSNAWSSSFKATAGSWQSA